MSPFASASIRYPLKARPNVRSRIKVRFGALLREAHRLGDALVSVSNRDLGDARDLRDFLLRHRLRAQRGGDVDRGGGDAGRRDAGRELLALDELEDVLRLPLDLHVEVQSVAESRDVVARVLRQQLEADLADERSVRAADGLSVDRACLRDFIERSE